MELATTFERLLGYDRWANGEALASLEALPKPPAKARELWDIFSARRCAGSTA